MTRHKTVWLARAAVSRRGFWAVVLAFSAISGTLALLAFFAVIPSLNQRTLQSLDAQLLRRAELAADHALIALGELFEGGFVGCEEASITQLKKAIYRYGVLKDIRVSNSQGDVLCSANPEALEVSADEKSSSPLIAVNRRITLFRVNQSGSSAMGVRWNYENNSSLDAIVSTGSLLFDILPQDLRENGTSSLTLSDGRPVADPDGDPPADQEKLHRVVLNSKRSPLTAAIAVD